MIYNFSKTPFDSDRMIKEIKDSAISTNLLAVTFTYPDELQISFDGDLSAEDETTLNAVVTAHTGNPIPAPVSPRQIRLALFAGGITDQQIIDALNTLEDPTKSQALIEWNHALEINRLHPLVDSIGAFFSMTAQQIDDLWIAAGAL